MNTWLRRLRGALSVGLTWALLWVILGILIMAGIWLVDPADIGPGEGPSKALPILALVGLLSGTGFAALLASTARRKTLGDLSPWRAGLLGLLGSAGIPWLMGADASMGVLTGALGALFASTSVAIARRGEPTAGAPVSAGQDG